MLDAIAIIVVMLVISAIVSSILRVLAANNSYVSQEREFLKDRAEVAQRLNVMRLYDIEDVRHITASTTVIPPVNQIFTYTPKPAPKLDPEPIRCEYCGVWYGAPTHGTCSQCGAPLPGGKE